MQELGERNGKGEGALDLIDLIIGVHHFLSPTALAILRFVEQERLRCPSGVVLFLQYSNVKFPGSTRHPGAGRINYFTATTGQQDHDDLRASLGFTASARRS